MYNNAREINKIKNIVKLDNGIVIEKHLDRIDGDVVVVDGDKVDYDAEIQSQIKNAGLQTILKMQTMRYGTLENAIARNEAKRVFGDVSNIPDSVGAQQAYIAKQNAELDKMAQQLGVSREELLKMTESTFNAKIEAMKKAQGGNGNEEG